MFVLDEGRNIEPVDEEGGPSSALGVGKQVEELQSTRVGLRECN